MRHRKTLTLRKGPDSTERLKIQIYQDVDSKFYARTKDPIFQSSPSVFLPASNLRDAENEAKLLLEVAKDVFQPKAPTMAQMIAERFGPEPAYIRDLDKLIESLIQPK